MEETQETEQAEISGEVQAEEKSEGRGERARAVLRNHFTAARIAYIALFTALAYVVTFFEFPIFPTVSFLKLDFANVFFLFEGFMFGPVEVTISILIKELLSLADSSTLGVGELANFIMSFAYVIVPSVGYRFLKGKGWVCALLGIACVLQIGVSFLVNRYINFPFFGEVFHAFGSMSGIEFFDTVWYYVLAFNAIKSVSISIVIFLLYKPLSRFIQITSARLNKRISTARRRRKEAREKQRAEKEDKSE
ncbi:MAG: ECF transporter S component [Clostridia bacterium]|nr:ECF transporter S component [Clostridia bacterium]